MKVETPIVDHSPQERLLLDISKALSQFNPLTPRIKALFDPKFTRVNDNDYALIDVSDNLNWFHVRLEIHYNGPVTMSSKGYLSWRGTEKVGYHIPGSSKGTNGVWSMPINAVTLMALRLHFKNNIVMSEAAIEAAITAMEVFNRENDVFDAMVRYRVDKKAPKLENYAEPAWALKLTEYQRLAMWCIVKTGSFALFMEQGTGKTAPVIRAAEFLAMQHKKDTGKTFKVLVVSPKTVRENWVREIEKFTLRARGRVYVLVGSLMERVKGLVEAVKSTEDDISIVVAGYETVTATMEAMPLLKWDMIILDESHFIKAPGSKRTKCFLDIRDCCEKRVILTGTPIGNSAVDLYPQMEFMRHGSSGFPTLASFRTFFAPYRVEQNKGVDKVENLPFLRERLQRVAFTLTKKEALPDLPEKVYDVMTCDMSPQQEKMYIQMRDELAVQIRTVIEDKTVDRNVSVNNILVMLLRLAQITSGFVSGRDSQQGLSAETSVDSPTVITRLPTNAKMDMLREELVAYLEDHPLSKVQIWSVFKEDVRAICEMLEQQGIKHAQIHGSVSDKDREKAQVAFNEDPDTRVVVGHPAVGGMGINLQGRSGDMNCDWVIYYSQGWSLIHRMQSEDRAHRFGTRVSVRYTDMRCIFSDRTDTIDGIIGDRLLKKADLAADLLDVKDIISMLGIDV